jgi:GntR family transcriptional regulator
MAAEVERKVPSYQRAQEALLAMMRERQLEPGARIPSERELAERLGLSRMTVRQGIDNLVRSGVLERAGTAGTRVASVSVVRVLDSKRAFSMSRMVRNAGARPGSRLLVFAPGTAGHEVAARLTIAPGSAIVTIRRLRLANDLPICIETSILAAARVPGLAAEDLAQNASLYQLLEDRYGIVPTDRESEISVSPVEALDAGLLGVQEGLNVLLYRSVVRDAARVPVEAVSSVNHPSRVVFSTSAAHIRL